MTGSVDKYRVYETPQAFAEDYANLIGKNKRYTAALGSGADPVKFATALKQGGYAEDGAYVQKMVKASEMVGSAILNKIGNNIVQDLRGGATPEQVVLALRNSPTIGSDVTQALKEGKPIERILEVAGGQAYQDYVKSSPTYGMGAIQKGVVGLGKAMQEGIDGTKELYHAATGNEKALAEDRARTAERQRLDAPLMATTAGKVGYMAGKALPYVVAGTATGGTSLLPQLAVQGTVGAVDGLTTPTTRDGERLSNTVDSTAWALGGTAAGYGAGKLIGKALSKFGASPEDAALIEQKIAAAKAQGLPVSASNLTNTGKAIAESLGDDASVAAFRAKADQALARQVGQRIGVQGADAIDSNLLNAADPYKHINPVLDQAKVTLTPQVVQDIASAVPANPLTSGISQNSTVRQAAANMLKAQQAGQPVPARALQELNSELKQVAASNAVSAGERKAAGQIVQHINGAINSALTPEQQAAYQLANEQFRNMKAVEQMVRSSYDTGSVTPRQMMIAAKSGRFKNAFAAGEAPYQDLASTAMDLYGPASGRGISHELAKSIGRNLDTGMMYHAAMNPTVGVPAYLAKRAASNLLGKAVTSENPTVIKVLTGTTDIQKKLGDPAFRKMLAKVVSTGGSASSALNRKDKDK